MRLQFKHQKFQIDAAKAVVDVFAGQPCLTPAYMMDRGINYQQNLTDDQDFTGWRNEPIVPELAKPIPGYGKVFKNRLFREPISSAIRTGG